MIVCMTIHKSMVSVVSRVILASECIYYRVCKLIVIMLLLVTSKIDICFRCALLQLPFWLGIILSGYTPLMLLNIFLLIAKIIIIKI